MNYINIDVWKTSKENKTSVKCDDKQQYKAVIEAAMISESEGCNYQIPMTPNQYKPTKKLNERKPPSQFSETFDVKHKTAICMFGAAKAYLKAIRTGNTLWSKITKRRGHTK